MSDKYIWMMVDLQNKELPMVVADSAGELARKCGCTKDNVYKRSRRSEEGHKSEFVKVKVEE